METIITLVDIGFRIHETAETARSNQRSCEMLGTTVYGLTMIAKEMIEFYTDEGVSPSAFTFLAQLERELEFAEVLVRKAGSMSPLQQFLFADKYNGEFKESMGHLNLLLTALNTTNSFLAAKNDSSRSQSKAASFKKSLSLLEQESKEVTFRSEVSSKDQAVWIQLSKTIDRLMNGVVTRDEAKQDFMLNIAKFYDADDCEGNLPALFKFLNQEIRKGITEKDERARLFNEMLLEVAVRLTLDPPDWTFCPLTGTIMNEPVTVKESPVETPIEKSFAEEWFFERGHKRCPITGQHLEEVTLVANDEIKQKIEAWKLETDWVELDDGEKKETGGAGGSADQSSSAPINEAADFSRDMIQAAKNGDTTAVAEFLEWGVDIDGRDEYGCTALIRACRGGRHETAEMLISKGANLERKEGVSTTPLCAAVSGGNLTLVQDLLDKGAYIEGRASLGFTPLIEAAYLGKENIVKALVNRGADVEAQDSQGNTALMKACEKGHAEIVKILVKEVRSSLLESQCQKSVALVAWRKQIVGTRGKPAYNQIEQILQECIKNPSSRGGL